jgi:hypothetical protein
MSFKSMSDAFSIKVLILPFFSGTLIAADGPILRFPFSVLRRKLPFWAETAPCPFEILAETLSNWLKHYAGNCGFEKTHLTNHRTASNFSKEN